MVCGSVDVAYVEYFYSMRLQVRTDSVMPPVAKIIPSQPFCTHQELPWTLRGGEM